MAPRQCQSLDMNYAFDLSDAPRRVELEALSEREDRFTLCPVRNSPQSVNMYVTDGITSTSR
jgi:hypothetical protein